MFSFKPIYFVIFALVFEKTDADISDKRLCIDANCSQLISIGKTLLRYRSIDEGVLSFPPNEDVKVFSYGAGSKPDLIGVEIRGKRGYVNKIHVKETQLLQRPELLVSTEQPQDKPEVPLQSVASEINANPTQQPYEIVDGTKIPLDPGILTTEVPLAAEEEVKVDSVATDPLETVPEIKKDSTKETLDEQKVSKTDTAKADKVNSNVEEDDTEDDDTEDDEVSDEDEEENEKNQVDNNVEKPSESLSIAKAESVVNKNLSNDFSFNNTEEALKISDPEGNNIDSENVESSQNVTESLDNVTSQEKSDHVVPTEPLIENIENKQQADPVISGETKKDNENDVIIEDIKKTDDDNTEQESVQKIGGTIKQEENSTISKEINQELPDFKNDTFAEETSTLPVISTELPLEVETPLPLELDTVTPNPLQSPAAENQKLDSNFVPEFKDLEDTSINKVKDEDNSQSPRIYSLFSKESSVESPEQQLSPSIVYEVPKQEEEILKGAEESISEVETNAEIISEGDVQDVVEDNDSSVEEDLSQSSEDVDFTQSEESDSEEKEITSDGIVSKIMSFFSFKAEEKIAYPDNSDEALEQEINPHETIKDENHEQENNEFCDSKDDICPKYVNSAFTHNDCAKIEEKTSSPPDISVTLTDILSSDMFLYLVTTALSVIILIFGTIIFDKCRREGPLIARINKLEQHLLTSAKENQLLQEKIIQSDDQKSQLVVDSVPNEVVQELNQKLAEMANAKQALEEQIQLLEKELDNSTEVGIELNKMIAEMLNSTDGSEILKENVEQMQKKLLEQQDTINTVNESLNVVETENYELKLELDISNKKVTDLQIELDRMVEKILKIEEEKDHQNAALEKDISTIRIKYKEVQEKESISNREVQNLKQQLADLKRHAEIKVKEYDTLKMSLNELKSMKNNKNALSSLLEVTEVRAQLEQLKMENLKFSEQLNTERETNVVYTTKMQSLLQDIDELRDKYDKADKEKVETKTKLEVLNNYFKEKEEQMQKDISKYETLWAAKEGEATSTTERIKYMQEELQNYKMQNESLKHEIVKQEVELKSQISMLEKKAHESWVANRQTERKLEEARQEAAQLRNRLTLRERALAESNNQIRMQSPLHQNGDITISPPPLDPTQSPPPLFNPRDHLTKSPPIPGMPPFLPPPLGGSPFMPPPPLNSMMSGFMPPLPPGLFPGDHRPPPLGRMSSPPPVGDRYTPESTVYSEYDRYDRRSPSPVYDSEYGVSPPSMRAYSPYNDRRDYNRPQARSNGRNSKGLHSSGSENDSLGKSNKKSHRKV